MDKRLSEQGTMVRVQGLLGAAEQHNGKKGAVIVPYNASSGMVGVALMEDPGVDPTMIQVKPENLFVFDGPNPLEHQGRAGQPRFLRNTPVSIQGLVGARQHNGKTGTVIVSYAEDSGRVGVRLGDGSTINVKPENLVVDFPIRVVSQFLPRSVSEIQEMTSLNLANEQITDLDGIEMMVSLVDLDLSQNEIVCLAPQRFPKSLIKLNLSGNRIKSLKECFYSRTRSQKYQQLPPEMAEYAPSDTTLYRVKLPKRLELLDVADNEIDSIDDVEFPPSLRSLSLEGNRIQRVDRVRFPVGLTYLDLSENKLTSLAGAVFPPCLKELNVSENPIASLEGVELPRNLRMLRLPKTCKVSIDFLSKCEFSGTSPNGRIQSYQLKKGSNDACLPAAAAAAAAAPLLSADAIAERQRKREEIAIRVAEARQITAATSAAAASAAAAAASNAAVPQSSDDDDEMPRLIGIGIDQVDQAEDDESMPPLPSSAAQEMAAMAALKPSLEDRYKTLHRFPDDQGGNKSKTRRRQRQRRRQSKRNKMQRKTKNKYSRRRRTAKSRKYRTK